MLELGGRFLPPSEGASFLRLRRAAQRMPRAALRGSLLSLRVSLLTLRVTLLSRRASYATREQRMERAAQRMQRAAQRMPRAEWRTQQVCTGLGNVSIPTWQTCTSSAQRFHDNAMLELPHHGGLSSKLAFEAFGECFEESIS